MIGRSGLTKQAECTYKYSSIAEKGTSSRARLNAKCFGETINMVLQIKLLYVIMTIRKKQIRRKK